MTPWPENHLFEKEHHLPFCHIFGFQPLIFRGVPVPKNKTNHLAVELVVEPTHLKNMSQIGSFPAVKIENIWNHHQAILRVCALFGMVSETVTPSKGESWPPTLIRFGQRTPSSKDFLKRCINVEISKSAKKTPQLTNLFQMVCSRCRTSIFCLVCSWELSSTTWRLAQKAWLWASMSNTSSA